MKWLKKTIKNLPIELLEYHQIEDPKTMIPLSEQWKNKINLFIQKYPCPTQSHLDLIENTLKLMRDTKIKNDTRQAVYR